MEPEIAQVPEASPEEALMEFLQELDARITALEEKETGEDEEK